MRGALVSLVLLIAGLTALYLYDPDAPGTTAQEPAAPVAGDTFRWEPEETAAAGTSAGDAREEIPEGARPIAPEQFAQPFTRNSTELERIAPREPLAVAKAEADTGPARTPLFRPKVVAAGLISYDEGTLQLEGIEVVEPETTCTAADGTDWPCGIIARTAFRNFLRGRALACVTPGNRWDDTLVTDCLLGTQDPAAWLAGHGWAAPKPGSPYEEMASLAKQEHKGIYGSDPRKKMPDVDSRVSVTLQPGQAPQVSE